MTAHDDAVKAAAEAVHLLRCPGCLEPVGHATPLDVSIAEAAVTAAAPHLLAPIEAEVERLREHRTGLTDAAIALAHQWERERDEAVAAERRRITAAIRCADVPMGYSADEALEIAARIAEGETSTTRDVDPGDAQDAGRDADGDNSAEAQVERLRAESEQWYGLWQKASMAVIGYHAERDEARAEVERLRADYTDCLAERDHYMREAAAFRDGYEKAAGDPLVRLERAARQRDEAVAAERRRIAAAIRAAGHPDGYHRANTSREWAGIYCADCAVTERSARIAEGETSTIRDADPGNAQDARREVESLRAEVERLRLLTSAEMVFVSSAELTAERNAAQERIAAALALHQPEGYFTPDGLADDCPTCDVLHPCATYRALTDAGDDATGTGEAS